jgi:Trk-type K+ transport system membrane component
MVTAYERALNVIEKKNVEFNFKRLGTFTVTGSSVTKGRKNIPESFLFLPQDKIFLQYNGGLSILWFRQHS